MSMSTSIVLVCAILCSLALGVLVAYGICLVMFRAFRSHSLQRSALRQVTLSTGGIRD